MWSEDKRQYRFAELRSRMNPPKLGRRLQEAIEETLEVMRIENRRGRRSRRSTRKTCECSACRRCTHREYMRKWRKNKVWLHGLELVLPTTYGSSLHPAFCTYAIGDLQ